MRDEFQLSDGRGAKTKFHHAAKDRTGNARKTNAHPVQVNTRSRKNGLDVGERVKRISIFEKGKLNITDIEKRDSMKPNGRLPSDQGNEVNRFPR